MTTLDLTKDFTNDTYLYRTTLQHIAVVRSADGFKYYINCIEVDEVDFKKKTGFNEGIITRKGVFDANKDWTYETVTSVKYNATNFNPPTEPHS